MSTLRLSMYYLLSAAIGIKEVSNPVHAVGLILCGLSSIAHISAIVVPPAKTKAK